MKMDRDWLVIGVFIGFLFCCLVFCGVLAFNTEPKVCEVSMGLNNGKEVHVRYGVVVGDM